MSSFFCFFFSWQSHSEWSTFLTICSSFIFVHLPSSTQPESVGSILALSHKFFNASKSTGETKGSPLWVFFRHYATFFRKFSKFIKGYPLAFFWSFRFVENVEWAWMASFWVFGIVRLKKYFFSKKISIFFWKNNFFQIFPIVVPWIFLSLRYGADLGRSRLVFSSDYNPHTDRSTF